MSKKTKIILFAISVVISIGISCFFLTGYYSVDTERIYFQGYTDYATKDAYIRDGRFISAIIFLIVGIFNPTIKTMHIISLILSIFILSVAVVQIYECITRYKKSDTKKTKIFTFLLSYTYIFSFIVADIFQFVDSFVISLSILCFIIASKKIVIERHWKIGFILTLLGVICYQGTIPVFIATATLITILESKGINKEFFKRILPCAIAIFVSALISVILVNLIPVITGMEISGRLAGINFIQRIKTNLSTMHTVIFYTFKLFPPYMWIALSMIIIILSVIVGIEKKVLPFSANVLFIFLIHIFSLLVMLPIQDILKAPRVAYVIGQAISGIVIYIYCNNFGEMKSKWYKNLIIAIMIIYFVITIVSIFKSTYDLKLANRIDEKFSQAIETEIERLEEQGITITKLGMRHVGNGENIGKYSELVRENSFSILGLYTIRTLQFYTGRVIESGVQDFTDEFINEHFDQTDEELQFYNTEDTLYILIHI